MRKPVITVNDCGNGEKALSINYEEGILLGTLIYSSFAYITIHDVTKEELEYMASELKRIADTMES